VFDELLDGNKTYGESFSLSDLSNRSKKHLAIVTCMDVRIDVLSLFGLEIGDANIMRNAGGRVTLDVIRSLVLSTTILGVENIVVLHHSDCALSGVSDDQVRSTIVGHGLDLDPAVEFLAMPDPDAALVADVRAIAESPLLPKGLDIAGWRYDVTNGQVTKVVPSTKKAI
jgi:carbonic anhydrase